MLISEAFERYRLDVIAFRGQSSKTEEQHQLAAKHLIRFVGDFPVGELTFEHVRLWKQSMEKERKSPETIRNYLIKLRVVLHHLRMLGVVSLNPEIIQLPRRSQKIPIFINPEEVTILINGCNAIRKKKHRARAKAIISLLYSSGIRVSELCSMNKEHVKNDFFTVLGKGGKAAPSFIDDRAMKYILEYLTYRTDNNEALFIDDINKRRITPGGVQEIMRRASKNAGLNRTVHPHVLRHSFATNLLRNGCDSRYVQALMHHSSIQTTQVYMHVVDEELHTLHRKYHSTK